MRQSRDVDLDELAHESAFFLAPPLMCVAAALAIAETHQLALIGIYVGGSLVLGGGITLIRRNRHADGSELRRRLPSSIPALPAFAAPLTCGLFAFAWGYSALVGLSFASQLVFAATIFTSSLTIPALATFGSRARS